MRVIDAFKEVFAAADEQCGHGPDSAVIEWVDSMLLITQDPTEDPEVDVFNVGVYSKAVWNDGGCPYLTREFKQLNDAVNYVDGFTDA
jgi:hypothetical protein